MTTKLIPDQDFGVTLAPQTNLLTNGGFEIWQRATSFSNPASVTYTADKWLVYTPGGSPTLTISRDGSVVDSGVYSMQVNCAAVNGATTLMLFQQIENLTGLYAGQTISFSIRVKTTLVNKVRARILDSAGGANSSFSAYHSGSGNWETLTVTRTIGGSGFANVAVGIIDPDVVVTGTWWLDSAMLVLGRVPLNFIPMHPVDDLARCFRYYEQCNPIYEGKWNIGRSASVNAIGYVTIPFVGRKAAVPTVTTSSYTAIMIHTPVTGNGASGADQANWPLTTTAGLNAFFVGSNRSTDQTTYSMLYVEFVWTAEVT